MLCRGLVNIVVTLLIQSLRADTPVKSNAHRMDERNAIARKLEQENEYPYDLSTHSVRFSKCQYVKMYDDDIAQADDTDDVFALKNFAIFRLCPSDDCDNCDENYGEYALEVEQYLESLAEFQKEEFQNSCDECEENCGDDSDDEDCVECMESCDKYQNLENYGYVDASNYIQCQQLEIEQDDDADDDAELELYIGPHCSSNGMKIVIGLFSNENCWEPYDADVEELLGYKLSYYLLKKSYSDSGCTSCKEVNWDNDGEDEEDEDEVIEFCENIYDQAAKCETKHGFDNGYVAINGYENQIENELEVCTFIDSLVWNSYDETGELMVGAVQDVIIRETTPLQAVVLSLLVLSAFGMTTYAYYINNSIDSQYPPLDISSSEGQLA